MFPRKEMLVSASEHNPMIRLLPRRAHLAPACADYFTTVAATLTLVTSPVILSLAARELSRLAILENNGVDGVECLDARDAGAHHLFVRIPREVLEQIDAFMSSLADRR